MPDVTYRPHGEYLRDFTFDESLRFNREGELMESEARKHLAASAFVRSVPRNGTGLLLNKGWCVVSVDGARAFVVYHHDASWWLWSCNAVAFATKLGVVDFTGLYDRKAARDE